MPGWGKAGGMSACIGYAIVKESGGGAQGRRKRPSIEGRTCAFVRAVRGSGWG
jgi:hypothetical protein